MSLTDTNNNPGLRVSRGERVNPDDVISSLSREQLIEAARIRRENRDLPFEERKRRAELRRAQSRPEPEVKPEPVDEVVPTSEEISAQVEAWKISEAIREAELVNIAYDAATTVMRQGVVVAKQIQLTTVELRGTAYALAPSDALSLFGALAMAVDGETARITLASGDVLELTHQDVSDIGRQLAGKPADEVSG